jgi:hypothetical protein
MPSAGVNQHHHHRADCQPSGTDSQSSRLDYDEGHSQGNTTDTGVVAQILIQF